MFALTYDFPHDFSGNGVLNVLGDIFCFTATTIALTLVVYPMHWRDHLITFVSLRSVYVFL